MLNRSKLLEAVITLVMTCSALHQHMHRPADLWHILDQRAWVASDHRSIGANGLLSGTYVTSVGCSADNRSHDRLVLRGENGGAITFSVVWQGCNSVTSWSGQYNIQTGGFQTLWLLTAAGAPVWNGIHTGTDTFTPQSALPK
jgi:hypothetical protein